MLLVCRSVDRNVRSAVALKRGTMFLTLEMELTRAAIARDLQQSHPKISPLVAAGLQPYKV